MLHMEALLIQWWHSCIILAIAYYYFFVWSELSGSIKGQTLLQI